MCNWKDLVSPYLRCPATVCMFLWDMLKLVWLRSFKLNDTLTTTFLPTKRCSTAELQPLQAQASSLIFERTHSDPVYICKNLVVHHHESNWKLMIVCMLVGCIYISWSHDRHATSTTSKEHCSPSAACDCLCRHCAFNRVKDVKHLQSLHFVFILSINIQQWPS